MWVALGPLNLQLAYEVMTVFLGAVGSLLTQGLGIKIVLPYSTFLNFHVTFIKPE